MMERLWPTGINGGAGGGGVVCGMAAALEEEREAAAAAAVGRNVERRRWKAEQKDLLDEMLPQGGARQVGHGLVQLVVGTAFTAPMEEPMGVLNI